MSNLTKPNVFILESLKFSDEKQNLFEGKIISDILALNGKQSMYYYIRTKRELDEIATVFAKSKYRYLHLSCHGSSRTMATTLDKISFAELAQTLRPVLHDRRLFISACEMVNKSLAKAIMPDSGCYSIIGPTKAVAFSDAAILWASFYHLMFNRNFDAMKREEIMRCCGLISNLFGVPLNYFGKDTKAGFKLDAIEPAKSGT